MTEDKNYPFIKNSYFPGKLLHAGDFTDEQNYHCRRSQFINQEFAGCGIVSGLTVTPYPEGRFILSTGSCLDGIGRPVVVKDTARIRVDGLEGFANVQDGEFILGISYDEKEVQSEYCSLAETGNKYCASRVEESWKLKAYSLEEYHKQEMVRIAGGEEFFDSSVLYRDRDVKIMLKVPLTAAAGGLFLVRLMAVGLTDRPVRLNFSCMLTVRGGLFQDTGEPFYRVREELTVVKDTVLRDIRVRAGLVTRYPLDLDITRYHIWIDGCCRLETEADTSDGDEGFLIGDGDSPDRGAGKPVGDGNSLDKSGGKQDREGNTLSRCGSTQNTPDGAGSLDQTCMADNRYISVSLTEDYEEAIRTRLRKRVFTETGWSMANWLPLARIFYTTDEMGTKIERIDSESVRYYAASPALEENIRRIRRESGITEGAGAPPVPYPSRPEPSVPGRKPHPSGPEAEPKPQSSGSVPGQKQYPPGPGPHPFPPGPEPYPCPPVPGPGPHPPQPFPPNPYITPEQVKELIDRDREDRIRRGVTVIPIPKHCRNGRVLYSEVISHGFPGEEVIIRYGRVWKDTNYAYWEREKKNYTFFYEREDLFPSMENNGWQAAEYGLKQNLEAGTFQIAVKLTRHMGKVHEKEIAVSWTAIRTT